MANFRREQAEAAAKERSEPAPASEPDKKPDPEPAAAAPADDDEPAGEADAEPTDDAPAGDKADTDLQARLDRVAKAEKRSRDQLARDVAAAEARVRATLETERAKMTADAKAQDETRKERFRRDPVAFAREWGVELSDADLNYIGRQFYGQTEAAQKDPKNRELVDAARRQREKDEAAGADRRRIDKLEADLKAKDAAAAQRAQVDAFLATTTKGIGAEHLVVKDLHAKNPNKAGMRLIEAWIALAETSGDEPTTAEVLAEAEKRERAELADRGIDVDAHVARLGAAAPKKSTPAAKPAASSSSSKQPATPPPNDKPSAVTAKTTRDRLAELKKRPDYPKI